MGPDAARWARGLNYCGGQCGYPLSKSGVIPHGQFYSPGAQAVGGGRRAAQLFAGFLRHLITEKGCCGGARAAGVVQICSASRSEIIRECTGNCSDQSTQCPDALKSTQCPLPLWLCGTIGWGLEAATSVELSFGACCLFWPASHVHDQRRMSSVHGGLAVRVDERVQPISLQAVIPKSVYCRSGCIGETFSCLVWK